MIAANKKSVQKFNIPEWPVHDEREKKALIDVLECGTWGVNGERVPEFAEKFSAMQDAKYGICVSNGTVALQIALAAAGIQGGDEVIVPAYTFLATASAVLLSNAIPVFADINPENYTIDPEHIEKLITKRTKAIIPVHIAGCPANMDRIMKIAEKNNLLVIEDCAQAHLAEWKGRKVGSIGDMGTFSFQSSKNMASGEGGIIITNNQELADKCWTIHNCGRVKGGLWYQHPYLGGNFRMTEFQAAILLVQMERIKEQNLLRNENAAYLAEELSKIDGITPLNINEKITNHAYHLFIFKYERKQFNGLSRDEFLKKLMDMGIPAAKGYVPLYKEGYLDDAIQKPEIAQTYKSEINYKDISLPNTEKACYQESIWLTQNILLSDEKNMDFIVDAIRQIQEKS